MSMMTCYGVLMLMARWWTSLVFGPNVIVQQQLDVLQELSHTDLHGLVPALEEEEETMRQFSVPDFELDGIFADIETKVENSGILSQLLTPQPQISEIQSSLRKRKRRRSSEDYGACFNRVGANPEEDLPILTLSTCFNSSLTSVKDTELVQSSIDVSSVAYPSAVVPVKSSSSVQMTSILATALQNPGLLTLPENNFSVLTGAPGPSSRVAPQVTSSLLTSAPQSYDLLDTTLPSFISSETLASSLTNRVRNTIAHSAASVTDVTNISHSTEACSAPDTTTSGGIELRTTFGASNGK
ncbi:hyphally regulated cell wall protein 1-like isoform X1 [Limulus polyphemus]|uniref:Hyphally regulated cell wall protein 1-like isoform X1 n=1 Tax=Limulus polyphemus TaxID=6850 RepID=A0ABM1S603_LIMPO|nr:hyphally regulated cell wall protein 1-like isoform X1 [Limulus polyphemus]XP_022239057.1 hyphally regulated cell wall protein 1-like isoform X1 [Limulus polyphemus]XP_022239058.1 hyphally regulated cell wall protein 1-like isoform X1 [Limulus polyphemus]